MRMDEHFTSPMVDNMQDGSAVAECRLAAWHDYVMAHWQVRFGSLGRLSSFIHLRRIPHRLLRNRGVRVTTPDGFVLHIPYGDWLVAQTLHGLLYEQQTLSRVLREIVTPGGLVVDGGAHLGLHTCLLADRAGPEGRVIAFEPNPEIVFWLRTSRPTHQTKEYVSSKRPYGKYRRLLCWTRLSMCQHLR